MSRTLSNIFRTIGLSTGLILTASAAMAASLPAQTALPVIFPHTLNAAKVHAGDPVSARTMQVVILPSGEQLAKGTVLVGHVVDARPFKFDDTPYARQQPSYLAIHFDSIAGKGAAIPVTLAVRALANAIDVGEAETPQGIDESDSRGKMVLVGGAHYVTTWKEVYSSDDEDIVGYNRKQGIFARLIDGQPQGNTGSLGCTATDTEQSVAVFSPTACGLFGYGSMSMPETGQSDGNFRLESRHQTVRLNGGSAALLQVIAER